MLLLFCFGFSLNIRPEHPAFSDVSLDSYALGEIAWLVHVASFGCGRVVCIQLYRRYRDDGHKPAVGHGQPYISVAQIALVLYALGHEDHSAASGANLLDVGNSLGGAIRRIATGNVCPM